MTTFPGPVDPDMHSPDELRAAVRLLQERLDGIPGLTLPVAELADQLSVEQRAELLLLIDRLSVGLWLASGRLELPQ